ncbi:hypothetical protein DSECCO2_602780 [anaerobic digester metagenome]
MNNAYLPGVFTMDRLGEAFALQQQCGLHRQTTFAEWERLLLWSTIDNPYRGDLPIGHMALHDGVLVAVLFYIYGPLRHRGREAVAPIAGDMGVHPDHRGALGLWFTEYYLAGAGFDCMTTTHGSKLGNLLWGRLGAKGCPGTVATYEGYVSLARKIARTLGPRLGSRAAAALAGTLLSPAARLKGYVQIRRPRGTLPVRSPYRLEGRAGEVDALCSAAFEGIGTGFRRDAAFLDWRYLRHPGRERYHAVAVGEAGALRGLALLRYEDSDGTADICEFLCRQGDADARDSLAGAVIGLAGELGVTNLRSKVVSPWLEPLWTRMGMARLDKAHSQFLIFSPDKAAACEFGAVYYAYGDAKFK